ncbi:LamG domain-containing protein [Micromonospora sp. NPDC050417]|uniref:LamG domain-containing protein n=1 Tax=Micromonospora sp. NPDC050417 TaxID=3364280 RepID=UPI0037A02BA4
MLVATGIANQSPALAAGSHADQVALAAPGVSSLAYPADGAAHGGPGVSGEFAFTAGGAKVVKYVYGWLGGPQPMTTVKVPVGGSYTAALTPPRYGYNTLQVYGLDRAGQQSPTKTYGFLVGAPSAPVAHWPLDTIDGHYLRDQVSGADLVVEQPDLGWSSDKWIIGEQTASFDADGTGPRGVATATGTGLDTSGSFSVAAWVRQPSAGSCPDGNRTAVSVDGAHVSAVMLSYNCDAGKWRLRIPAQDEAEPTFVNAWAAVTTPADKWTHLVGVWDEAEGKASLWVNGVLDSTSIVTAPAGWADSRGDGWAASGPVVIGRGRANDANRAYYSGEVRDVRLWNRAATHDDLWGSAPDSAAGTQGTTGILAPTEIASWDFNGGLSSGCARATSNTYWSPVLRLYGCTDPYSTEQTSGYTSAGHDDNDALWFNEPQPQGYGSAGDGHAETSGAIVASDQSFTVSTWVRLPALTDQEQVVLQHGAGDAAMKLYAASDGTWRFGVASSGGTWSVATSDAPAATNAWVHLTGVFDAASGSVRLYVNGVRQAVTGTGAAGLESYPLYVGAGGPTGGYLSGAVDQVKLFAGAMSDGAVASLHDNS